MPPKKHARSESSAQVQSAAKKQDRQAEAPKEDTTKKPENADAASDALISYIMDDAEAASKQPHDYICIKPPYWCKPSEDSDDDDDDDDEDDEDEDEDDEDDEDQPASKVERPNKTDEGKDGGDGKDENQPDSCHLKLASEHPSYKWTIMWKTWGMLKDYIRFGEYTEPQSFGMYIYNDFHWYGLAELIENLLNDFEKAKKSHAKSKDIAGLYEMWAPIATLAHFFTQGDAGSFQMMDDGERTGNLIGLIGCTFVTMLHTLLQAKELKADSQLRDLGLVISLFLNWAHGQEDYGTPEEEMEWRALLFLYVKTADIDLEATGIHGIGKVLREYEDDEEVKNVNLPTTSKADPFEWAKKLKEYKAGYGLRGKIGGNRFNILRMSRGERAESDLGETKKDPLADISDKKLKEMSIGY